MITADAKLILAMTGFIPNQSNSWTISSKLQTWPEPGHSRGALVAGLKLAGKTWTIERLIEEKAR